MHKKEFKPQASMIMYRRIAQLQVWHPGGQCIKHIKENCSECKKIMDNDLVMVV